MYNLRERRRTRKKLNKNIKVARKKKRERKKEMARYKSLSYYVFFLMENKHNKRNVLTGFFYVLTYHFQKYFVTIKAVSETGNVSATSDGIISMTEGAIFPEYINVNDGRPCSVNEGILLCTVTFITLIHSNVRYGPKDHMKICCSDYALFITK